MNGPNSRGLLFWLLLALLASGCTRLAELGPTQPVGASPAEQVRRVTILYTGFGRGTIDPYDACT